MSAATRFAAVATACLLAAPVPGQTPDDEAAGRLFQSQDWAGAAAAYERLARARPEDGAVRFRLGVALHALGRMDDAARALEAAERLGGPAPATAWRLARVQARLGEREQAFAALKRAVAAGFGAIAQFDTDADIQALAGDARFAEARLAVDRNARPCAYAPEYRSLDFWIGEWDVAPTGVPPAGPPGRSRIQLVEDQCVVSESYSTAAGYAGRSYNTYHPDKRHWEQFWVDNKGAIHHYTGHARDGNLYYEADGVRTAGPASPPAKVKMTFFDQGSDQVRQLGEQSTDGGKTWSVSYDLTYRRRKPDAGGCAAAADPGELAAVRAVADGMIAANNARDLARILDSYAEDAVLLPPNEPSVSGRERIRARYEGLFESSDPALEGRMDQACVDGTSAFVRGHVAGRRIARSDGAERRVADAYLMRLARGADGRWRISHLMWHAAPLP